MVYDVLRAIRKSDNISDLMVFVQDILYFTVIAFTTFMLLMAVSNGEFRGYIVIGLIFGFIICLLTLSRFTVKLLSMFFVFINKIYNKLIDRVNRFFDIVSGFICKTVKKCGKLLNKSKKIFKKHLKKSG